MPNLWIKFLASNLKLQLTILQVYAPDSSYNDTNSNMFYDQLQGEINK